jgi:multiple antibiotic resistance protein
MAKKGAITAFLILAVFAVSGSIILDMFGIGLPAFRIAGGILLLLLAIDMVMAKPEPPIKSETQEEREETLLREDISVFPLAIPLLSGPAAITMLILLMKQAEHNSLKQFVVLLALVANLLICWLVLTFASKISGFLGRTGINVLNRIFGILLTALACQFFIDGIIQAFHLK